MILNAGDYVRRDALGSYLLDTDCRVFLFFKKDSEPFTVVSQNPSGTCEDFQDPAYRLLGEEARTGDWRFLELHPNAPLPETLIHFWTPSKG